MDLPEEQILWRHYLKPLVEEKQKQAESSWEGVNRRDVS
jgi:hypothetical protein